MVNHSVKCVPRPLMMSVAYLPDDVIPVPVPVNVVSVAVVSSSEMTRWIAAFSPASREDDDEKLYSERNG